MFVSTPDSERAHVRVLLISGPSGSGKSRLASALHAAHGWPIVELDDFYRDGRDPLLPTSTLGLPDWDHVSAWDREAALNTLHTLTHAREVTIPRYDISTSRVNGMRVVRAPEAPIIVAEGIFAAHLITPLDAQELLAGAWCIRDRPWFTFAKRFARDVRQRRKSVPTLWRRGHQLRRAEPGIVEDQIGMGAAPMSSGEARQQAQAMAAVRTPGAGQRYE